MGTFSNRTYRTPEPLDKVNSLTEVLSLDESKLCTSTTLSVDSEDNEVVEYEDF